MAGPASMEWIDIWHLLTHGHTSRHGLSRWNDGWGGRPHDFFCPLNNVVVYDHLVTAEHLREVKLIFLTGIVVSSRTQAAIAEAVARGAICITNKTLMPGLATDNFLSDEVRRTVAPFLGKPDAIRYRFGNRVLTIRRGKSNNDITVSLQDENR
jgi:hypothetical protein